MDRMIEDAGALRQLHGEPSERARKKQLDRLDRHCRRFIELSPFLVMATADADGGCDASPKGDAPGFVLIEDDRTLLIPDRLGNNRLDGHMNILGNPHVGLIFFIPGVNETLRVNGRAAIVTEPTLLEGLAVQGKTPKTALRVHVEEAYLHCGKALIRSRLWNPETRIERSTLPSLGRMVADQIEGVDVAESEARIEQAYRDELY